jgi:DoxX-like family
VPLGALEFAGAVGLLAGIAVPLLGAAAAIGLILYFVCAIFAHLRIGWYATLPFPAMLLSLAVAALVLRVVTD